MQQVLAAPDLRAHPDVVATAMMEDTSAIGSVPMDPITQKTLGVGMLAYHLRFVQRL